MDILQILIMVTNTDMYASGNLQTGLWLSEVTHIYHAAKEHAYKIILASPKGGNAPVDPESLKPLVLDELSKHYWEDSEFRQALRQTLSFDEVSGQLFDCIYLAGGHGTMYDFPGNTVLQKIIKDHYENNKKVTAICHGVSGLLNVKLSDGEYLVKGKKLTGFTWFEESIARRKKEVPFDLEASLKARGANFRKALIPMTSNVVVEGRLITGENPFSSIEMAKVVIQQLNEK